MTQRQRDELYRRSMINDCYEIDEEGNETLYGPAGPPAWLKCQNVKQQIEQLAPKLNIADSDAAESFLDRRQVEFDIEGKPTNLEALLTQIVQKHPHLTVE